MNQYPSKHIEVLQPYEDRIGGHARETLEAMKQLLTLIPYQRIGQPEDIGQAAVWLASDDYNDVNGISLFVDGGMALYPGFTTYA